MRDQRSGKSHTHPGHTEKKEAKIVPFRVLRKSRNTWSSGSSGNFTLILACFKPVLLGAVMCVYIEIDREREILLYRGIITILMSNSEEIQCEVCLILKELLIHV